MGGTRINDAYQDPHLPQEIALRRTIIREIRHHLENKHLKETQIQYISTMLNFREFGKPQAEAWG